MRRISVRFVRPATAFIILWLTAVEGRAQSADEMRPYEARIIAPGAAVLSGPGETYYATDTLAQGEIVEVYRKHSDGWLGIRPPQDSFSWVFARHVKRLDNGLAEVEKDDVPSRIGSRLSDQRNAVQIRLKKGEVVEIAGEQTIDGQTWYKIAPPAGEFRWIHSRDAARTDQASPAESPPVEPALPPIVTVAATESATANLLPLTQAIDAQSTDQQDWRAAPAQAAASEVVAIPLVAESADKNSAPPASEAASTASRPPSTQTAVPLPDGLARQLTEIEMRLSRIVAEPPATWQIEPLAQEAEQLLAQDLNADERRAVQTTLTKIDRFASIGRRYRAGPIDTGSIPTGQPPITPIADTRQPTADSLGYDAVGTLRPVVSKRPGAPQFALVNERGQVVSFVTPSPDVNLKPYVGHRIGITGSRGYIPEFQRAHVTAGRVAPLGERLLR